jgi:hypothetical protein
MYIVIYTEETGNFLCTVLYWKEGPVRMTGTGYCKLAQCIVDSLQAVTFSRAYSSTETTTQRQPAVAPRPVRGRGRGNLLVDWATRRQVWVNQSDTVVHCTHTHNHTGGR